MTLPEPGAPFCGFQIESELGEGGFATVYAARPLGGGELVALKVLRPETANGYAADTRARFGREVDILSRLRCPHTVRLLQHGEENGLLYLVFEHLPGRDLADVLESRGRLDPPMVAAIVRQVATSLREAHEAGLLHRDLKPHNIRLISPDGAPPLVKLLDFGIARSSDNGHPSITKTGELIGTPRYMSPEQLTGKPLSAASDIYGLGMVAFEMVMGPHALQGNNIFAQIDRMRSGHVFSMPELERANTGLMAVIQRMTARKPEERFGTALAVLNALDQLEGRAPGIAPVAETRPPARHMWLIGAIVTSVLGCVVIAIALQAGDDSPKPPAAKGVRTGPSNIVRQEDTPMMAPPNDSADVSMPSDFAAADVTLTGDLPPRGTSGCGLRPPFEGVADMLDEVWTFVPTDYDPNVAHPVVILTPDDSQNPVDFLDKSGFISLADAERFVVITPKSSKRTDARRDIESLDGMVKSTARQLCVDSGRIFVVGHDTGTRAMLAVSCEGWVTAVAGNSFIPENTAHPWWCERPTPAILLSPTASRVFPLDGTSQCAGKDPLLHIDDFEKVWRERNGNTSRPKSVGGERGGRCREWSGTAVFRSCLVDGGEGWPGIPVKGLRATVSCPGGRPPMYPTARVIWDFFKTVPSLDVE